MTCTAWEVYENNGDKCVCFNSLEAAQAQDVIGEVQMIVEARIYIDPIYLERFNAGKPVFN